MKNQLINLHAHSSYSDGHDSVIVMAQRCKELGHAACVITDHVYSKPDDGKSEPYCIRLQEFKKLHEDAKAIYEMTGYPVIIGIELSLKGYEEVVVLGRDCIEDIFEIRDERGHITIEDIINLRTRHHCAVNLCHPGNCDKFIAAGGHFILDGYEYIHSGTCMFKGENAELMPEHRVDPYKPYGLTRLCNSDAHWQRSLYRCCNILEEDVPPIITEVDIIDYLRFKRKIGFHIEEYRSEAQQP